MWLLNNTQHMHMTVLNRGEMKRKWGNGVIHGNFWPIMEIRLNYDMGNNFEPDSA